MKVTSKKNKSILFQIGTYAAILKNLLSEVERNTRYAIDINKLAYSTSFWGQGFGVAPFEFGIYDHSTDHYLLNGSDPVLAKCALDDLYIKVFDPLSQKEAIIPYKGVPTFLGQIGCYSVGDFNDLKGYLEQGLIYTPGLKRIRPHPDSRYELYPCIDLFCLKLVRAILNRHIYETVEYSNGKSKPSLDANELVYLLISDGGKDFSIDTYIDNLNISCYLDCIVKLDEFIENLTKNFRQLLRHSFEDPYWQQYEIIFHPGTMYTDLVVNALGDYRINNYNALLKEKIQIAEELRLLKEQMELAKRG